MTTAYSQNYGLPATGQLAQAPLRVEAWQNAASADLPVGVAVKASAEGSAVLPSAATDVVVGFIANSYARNPSGLTGSNGIKDGDEMNVLAEGAIYVAVEQAMAVGDNVFVRFATKGGNTQLGKVRKDADGVAEVHTVTPTAADSKIYVLRVEVDGKNFTFEYVSDASGTATEIVTGLKALMAADAEFTALVVGSGTATLILTGQTAGKAFTVQSEGDGVLADVTTTPAAATALRVKGARVLKGGSSTVPACIYFSASAEAAAH